MKWAIVGASDIAATQVIPALRACGQDVAVVLSSGRQRAEAYAHEHSISAATDSLSDALAGVEAAYISSTNEKHFQQTMATLASGTHVLCEKPLAIDVASARAMVRAAADANLVLATNHHLRNSPVLSRMRELVASGHVGALLSVRVSHAVSLPERLRGWRLTSAEAGGGVILDLTVHDVDAMRFVTGLEPTSITAVGLAQRLSRALPDAVMTAGTLGSDVLFSTHDAFTVAHNITSFEVHGDKGSLIGRNCMTPLPVGTLEVHRDKRVATVATRIVENLYTPNIEAFLSAVNGSGEPVSTGDDGRRSLETAVAAASALNDGRTVRLDLDHEYQEAL